MKNSGLILLSVVLVTACSDSSDSNQMNPDEIVLPEPPAEILELKETFAERMQATAVPGLAAAIVKKGRLVWSTGMGKADLDAGTDMSADSITSVASISKTLTNAAIMQLWEQELFDLDDDINLYLPFTLTHPIYPDVAITFRHLLTHTASLRDTDALWDSYQCGDPALSLSDWTEGALSAGGAFNTPESTFFPQAPGELYRYSNMSYGLLGYLVERISGQDFADYTRTHLLTPLKMNSSVWYPSGVDPAQHVTAYEWRWSGEPLDNPLFEGVPIGGTQQENGLVPFCLYTYPNYPDGLLRSSANALTALLLAHMNDGTFAGNRILREETLDVIFSEQGDRGVLGGDSIQGLTWHTEELTDGSIAWGHTGGDYGISSIMLFRPEVDTGIILHANRTNVDLLEYATELFQVAEEFQ